MLCVAGSMLSILGIEEQLALFPTLGTGANTVGYCVGSSASLKYSASNMQQLSKACQVPQHTVRAQDHRVDTSPSSGSHTQLRELSMHDKSYVLMGRSKAQVIGGLKWRHAGIAKSWKICVTNFPTRGALATAAPSAGEANCTSGPACGLKHFVTQPAICKPRLSFLHCTARKLQAALSSTLPS